MSSEDVCNLIKALPSNIVPKPSKPSKVIAYLIRKRQRDHIDAVNEMRKKMKEIRIGIENKLRTSGETFLDAIDNLKNQIELMLNTKTKSHYNEPLDLNDQIFESVLSEIWILYMKRIAKVNEFYKFATDLEQQRSDQFILILRECYEKMHRNYHILPHDIQQFFENEILDINRITLNNFHCYDELHYDLKLQIANDMRLWIFDINNEKDRYKIEVKKIQIKSLVDVRESTDKKYDSWSLKKPNSHELEDPLSTFFDVELWSKQTQATLTSLDNNAKKLVSLYKTAVVNVFNRFFDELQKVTDAMINERKEENPDIDYINSEVYKPLIDNITKQYTYEISDLQKLWNSITQLMQSNIQNTHNFLHKSAHLWDFHFKRIEDLQSVILRDLNFTMDQNDRLSQEHDKVINTTLDRLRTESTQTKLDRNLSETRKLLDVTVKLFFNNCKSEKKILERYMKLIGDEIDLLVAEIERFLGENHENNSNSNQIVTHKRNGEDLAFSTDRDDLQGHLIPHQMKACRYQVDAVNNWMFGLWEAIKLYMKTCRKELTDQAEEWIGKQSEKLDKRLGVKIAIHKSRYDRIKAVIYDVRLQELNDHIKKYNFQFEKAISDEISKLSNLNMDYKQNQDASLTEFRSQIDSFDKRLADSKNSKEIDYLISKLQKLIDDAAAKSGKDLETVLQLHKETETKCQVIVNTFSESIKLFSEGGRYSSDEAKVFAKKIKKYTKSIPKKLLLIGKETSSIGSKSHSDFSAEVGTTMQKLELSKGEFLQNEYTMDVVKKLQQEIRREVYDVKYKMKKIEAWSRYFVKIAKIQQLEKQNNLQTTFDECLKQIVQLSKYLNIQGNDVMIGNLNQLISKCSSGIEDKAETFYNNHPGEIINKGKFQLNFNDFMDEVKSTLNHYRLQCDICWLESVQSLIDHILNLIKFIDQYYDDTLSKLMTEDLLDFNREIIKTRTHIDRERLKLEGDYIDLFDDLMKLESNENRERFLQKLDLKSVEINQGHNEMMVIFVNKIIESLTNQYGFIQEKTIEIKGKLENLDDNDVLNNTVELLFEQFSERFNALQNYTAEDCYESVRNDENLKLLEKTDEFTLFKQSYSFNMLSSNRCDIEHFIKEKLEKIDDKYKSITAILNEMTNLPDIMLEDFRKIWFRETV